LAAVDNGALPDRARLDYARERATSLRRQMIAAQEELDWQCYRSYGLLPPGTDAPPEVALGERAFEIVLARRMAAARSRPLGSSATAPRPSPRSRRTGPRTTAKSCSAASS
jgi:hypothetical protein